MCCTKLIDLMKSQNKTDLFENKLKEERGITISLFVVVVSCLVIVIHLIPMPKRTSVSQTLETLVLESIAIAVDVPEEIESENVEEEEDTSVEDIDELLSSFLIDSPVEISQSENELLERESNTSQVQKEFEFDFGTGDENVFGSGYSEDLPQAERRQRSALKPTIDAKFVSDTKVDFSNDVSVVADLTSEREVLDSVFDGLDRSNLTEEEIAREDNVVLWITEDQEKSLTPVMDSWLKLQTTDLIFKDEILLDNENYTVSLAYSPVNRILKIVLIKDDEIFYFIDPGLQNRANYFERGHVVYEGTEIVMVESEEQSVQSYDAIKIFGLFSEWFKNKIK